MVTLQQLMRARAKASELVEEFDLLIAELSAEEASAPSPSQNRFERVYDIAKAPQCVKGTKPTGIFFPNRERVSVGTWKALVTELMKDCLKDAECEKLLLEMRGIIGGRTRKFLDRTPADMGNPVELKSDLFMEFQYDAETLLKIALHRILDKLPYDYSKIQVAILEE